jgi:hypothetical protein
MRSAAAMRSGRDVHRGRKRIIRRRADVDTIVLVSRFFGTEFASEQLERAVGFRRRRPDDAERVDRKRHPVSVDAEVLPRAFALCAAVTIGGNLDRTEAVGLDVRGT